MTTSNSSGDALSAKSRARTSSTPSVKVNQQRSGLERNLIVIPGSVSMIMRFLGAMVAGLFWTETR